jgi:hypothetical protein
MCGCNKGKRGVTRRANQRASVGPRSISGGASAGASPEQLRALGLQNNTSAKSANKLNAERLQILKAKRDLVRKKLNK